MSTDAPPRIAYYDLPAAHAELADALAVHDRFDAVFTQGGSTGTVRAFLDAGHPMVPMAGEAENGFRKLIAAHSDEGLKGLSYGQSPGLVAQCCGDRRVRVTDPLPGLSALSCAPTVGSSLAPTERMSCTATYGVTQADVDSGEIVNTATAIGEDSAGGGSVSDQDSVSTTTAQNPSIGITKSFLANADEDALQHAKGEHSQQGGQCQPKLGAR